MGLNQLAADVQPEAGAAHTGAAADEPLEHPLQLGGRQARAVIDHRYRRLAVVGGHSHLDVAAVGRVLHGVVEQVRQNLVDAAPVGPHPHRTGHRVDGDGAARIRFASRPRRVVYEVHEVDDRGRVDEFAGVERGGVEHVGREAMEPAGISDGA